MIHIMQNDKEANIVSACIKSFQDVLKIIVYKYIIL